jgi:hypothetical protein
MNVLTKAFNPPVRYNLPKTLSCNNPNLKTAKSLKKTRRDNGISSDGLFIPPDSPLNTVVTVESGANSDTTIETLHKSQKRLMSALMI